MSISVIPNTNIYHEEGSLMEDGNTITKLKYREEWRQPKKCWKWSNDRYAKDKEDDGTPLVQCIAKEAFKIEL